MAADRGKAEECREDSEIWQDILDHSADFVGLKRQNSFLRESDVTPTNVPLQRKRIPLEKDPVSGHGKCPTTGFSSERSRNSKGCTVFWRSSLN
jgi:hypothetical protein